VFLCSAVYGTTNHLDTIIKMPHPAAAAATADDADASSVS
jgi:hypothetical protein